MSECNHIRKGFGLVSHDEWECDICGALIKKAKMTEEEFNIKDYIEQENKKYTHIHPWADFLHYRAQCILWLKNECRNTDEQIAQQLSMDERQVCLIRKYLEDD